MIQHQIAIVGGQITPVFWGIKEKSPQVVHLLYTKDSIVHIPIIKHLFPSVKVDSYQVEPYDFEEIKSKVEEIILAHPNVSFELNLTGGTKVMALACQYIFNIRSLDVFYIDQQGKIFDFSKQSYTDIMSKIGIDTFIKLSGHQKYSASKITDFTHEEYIFAKEISQIPNNTLTSLINAVKSNIKDIDRCDKFTFSDTRFTLQWNSPDFALDLQKSKIGIKAKRAFNIAFNGGWWELLVADSIKKWRKIYELNLNVELYSKTTSNIKNEIDIVVSTGKKLIFIECKSGYIKQDDINKIRTVNKLYGGVACKSILVCKYKPRPDIIEKCKDLGIAIFYDNNLIDLIKKLDTTVLAMELY